ncbi:MAG: hypothetical protein ACI9LG_001454 [Moritella dasanensis]|jgi:hypothetical protein
MPSSIREQLNKISHAQRERLAFIDFSLQYFGQISRTDLINHFMTGLASGTRDFTLYKALAAENLLLVHQTKQYFRTSDFNPLFSHNPETILTSLCRGFGDGITCDIKPSEQCFDAVRLVHPNSETIAALMRAIRHHQPVHCHYVSLSSGESQRELLPHAIINNGHRWHVRAFDRKSNEFRDFVCTRFIHIEVLDQPINTGETRDCDKQWNTLLPILLVPHPNLIHPLAIELDYGMCDGVLKLEVRSALLGYLMQQWHVDCSLDRSLDPRQYPLALANFELLSELNNLNLFPGVSS